MDSDEFSTSPVPLERSIPWGKIAVTNVLFSICLPSLITGLDLAIAAPRRYFLSGIIVGSLVLTFIGILTSVLGSRTRLSSYMLARIAFGTHGSTLLNLAFALSLLGWFGVNINLFGDAMVRLMAALWGYSGPVWPVELVGGLMMTGTTLVGGFVVGAVIMPDTCRFIEKPRGAVWTAVLTYFVSSVIVTVIGGLAALATGKVEILDLMLFMGLGAGAFIIVLGGSWILNALNLYSAALSIGVAVPQSRRGITTVVAGVAGTLVAFLQILDHFLTFLFYLSIVFVPIASIIIVDFFLVRPAAYAGAALNSIKPVEAAALAYGALRWRPLAAYPESV